VQRGRVLCIGGATVDRTYRLAGPPRFDTSNPAEGRRGYGGVARNVAENLARLGATVGLITAVGGDPSGRALAAALASNGADTRGVAEVPGASTAEYAAILTPEGDLTFGLADMAILDTLTPAVLATHAPLIAAAEWVFADCNLPAASLAALAQRSFSGASYRLAVDAVSVEKSARLPQRLDGIDLLVLNRAEAEAVLARTGPISSSPEVDAVALCQAGCDVVVLTLGAAGAVAASREGTVRLEAVPVRTVDVTGAGDALVAATLYGLVAGASLVEAVALGCRAAAHTVAHLGTVSPGLAAALNLGAPS